MDTIHASCVRLGAAGAPFAAPPDAGVLLLGASGAGKSELALRLIARGAELVADDRTELFVQDGCLFARAPMRGRGLIEVRGVGIVTLPFADKARIALAVRLEQGPRLPEPRRFDVPVDLAATGIGSPPLIVLPNANATAEKIVLAVAAFERGLHHDGEVTL